ncbi:MAG: ABC transporter permease [Acidobacteriota bacterium]|jgi:putative ABC transport system permease protein
MNLRRGLAGEILAMAWESLRTHKMRSVLTVLGIVIGITMVVGVTSLIRGFDSTITGQIQGMGPDTAFVATFSIQSITSGQDFRELFSRPEMTAEDARAIGELPSVKKVSMVFQNQTSTAWYQGNRTASPLTLQGVAPEFLEASDIEIEYGRMLSPVDEMQRADVALLGATPARALFGASQPIGHRIRIAGREYRVIGVLKQRAISGLFGAGADNFILIPSTNFRKLFGTKSQMPVTPPPTLIVRAADGVPTDTMVNEVEALMRIRHGLRADQPNDFDLLTQESIMELWRQISTAFFLVMVALSSVALMVGGIGVMAIMLVSVTERTREIGIRKAIGARRGDIMYQFLAEAAALAAAGGAIGVAIGSGIGYLIYLATGFPVSLPWWSFAVPVAFSSLIGIFFGIYPASRAAGLDPVEALRYE